MRKPLIDKKGEVRALGDEFFARAKRGRPAVPEAAKKQRINLTLDPDVVARLHERPNMSAYVNRLVRQDLAAKRTAAKRR
jgi:hypothetical protein